ncbi:NAD(P)H-dependent oxidoreductase [Shivajiella indica]|uniref:NAD(P)H-dependent oxidoreductase n=1 Tax=Shivajiella indica TaxID=872115 RepID=A0ABW5BD86_9BACT
MRKILVIFAHPKFEHSLVNQKLLDAVKGIENIQVLDLYELYPDFNIDVQVEQEHLIQADIIIWHHPIYWYSAPPLLKQWLDLVLEFGWAYGPGGVYLKGKYVFNCVSSGGTEEAYSKEGRHGHTLKEFLLPFYQTAKLCNMIYLPPFHVGGTHKIQSKELTDLTKKYGDVLKYLRDIPEIPEEIKVFNDLSHFTL